MSSLARSRYVVVSDQAKLERYHLPIPSKARTAHIRQGCRNTPFRWLRRSVEGAGLMVLDDDGCAKRIRNIDVTRS